jgi:prepilin-type N-terminal cleavage/methylation domain-containing protein
MLKKQRGFTLIEIAIVLVIIGLLLGGVLKGQELITGARVRNFIQQQDGIKAAYFGFLDRYRALPGDYTQATTNIAGVSTSSGCGENGKAGNGDGDGTIEASGTTPTTTAEHTLVWEHLQKSGFINGSYTCKSAAPDSSTSPSNPYGSLLDLQFDADFNQGTGTANRHNLKTGDQVPSDVLAEIDRKVDDGNPTTGSFRSGGSPAATCVASSAWVMNPVGASCSGRTLF